MIKRSLRSKNLISRMGVLEPHNSSIAHETSTILHSCKLKEETKQTRMDICHKEPCVLLLSSDCAGQQMGTTARFKLKLVMIVGVSDSFLRKLYREVQIIEKYGFLLKSVMPALTLY